MKTRNRQFRRDQIQRRKKKVLTWWPYIVFAFNHRFDDHNAIYVEQQRGYTWLNKYPAYCSCGFMIVDNADFPNEHKSLILQYIEARAFEDNKFCNITDSHEC